MRLTSFFGTATVALSIFGSQAYANNPSTDKSPADAPSDSVSMAVATVWADYIRPQIKSGGEEYTNGVFESFDLPADRQAYYRGLFEGMAIKQQLQQMEKFGFNIDWAILISTLKDAVNGNPTGFTPVTADAYLSSFAGSQSPKPPLSDTHEKEFLKQHAAQPGVITTPSGLLFEVITEGEGTMPTVRDKVKVRYTGRLSDGTVFDETNGEGIIFPVGSLIPGFTEGLTMMKPGGTYRLYIPPTLGYGDSGAGSVIPPGAVLDFTVELLEVLPTIQP